MNVLAKVQFGSKLYGTAVETSDDDYRAVYLPTLRDCVLLKAKDAWEDKTEDDTSWFSLQHFCRLALEGQSIAIELLTAPPEMVVATSPVWKLLQAERKRFYTKNMHSFIGYAKTMSGKYSARIDRLNETQAVLKAFESVASSGGWDTPFRWNGPACKLSDIWDILPESPNAQKSVNDRNTNIDKRCYKICGRELQATVTISHAYSVVSTIYSSYGERVRNAKDGKIEWKALGHAFRAALQCKEIVETGDLRFPLRDAEWLRELRLGHLDFFKENLDQRLDELILEVQRKMEASSLPDHADPAFVEQLILDAYDL